MKISPINSYANFKGSVCYKNQKKASNELDKFADSEVGFLEPSINKALKTCMSTIGKKTPNNFERSLDIKFHQDSKKSNYYLTVTAFRPDNTSGVFWIPDIKRRYKIVLPCTNYLGTSTAEVIVKPLIQMVKDLVLDGNPGENSVEAIFKYKYSGDKTMAQVIYENLD